MVTFNIVCALLFLAFWASLLIKGTAFMALHWVKRTLIMLGFAAFMATWIVVDHIVIGR